MISGSTRLAAVIGDPVRHSLSPVIHNAAFAACDLDWAFVALPVVAGSGAEAVEAMRAVGIDGLSVTMPHKAAAAAAADHMTPVVQTLGGSNCLYRDGDRIIADSTDGDGFMAAYRSRFGQDLSSKKVLVVGAGGAARAIVEAVGRSGSAGLTVINRSSARAESMLSLAEDALVGRFGDPEVVANADVVINATAVGMSGGPDPDGVPLPVEALHEGQTVVDIVYEPRPTPLLEAAKVRGAATDDGVAMLIHQAGLAFERWTGVTAPIEAMTAAVGDVLAARSTAE